MKNPPVLTKTDLFTAGVGGYRQYRIPGIVATPGGAILVHGEARNSKLGDWGHIDLCFRRSTDGGVSWNDPVIFQHPLDPAPLSPYAPQRNDPETHNDLTLNNPCAISDPGTGLVHFLYCVDYARCFYMRSQDDGVTFSTPVEITGAFEPFRSDCDWKVLATGPGHGIKLTSGRLVVPVWIALAGEKGYEHHPSTLAVIYSDDNGVSWHAGDIVRSISEKETWNLNETSVVELSDGRVMLSIRSTRPGNRRLISYSADGATGWSAPAPVGDLWDPVCMAGIARLSRSPESDRDRLIFSNPIGRLPRPDGRPGYSRNHLGIKLSYDEGSTWPIERQLEEGMSGYSDLAVLPDGTILCFYERRNAEGADTMTLARFNLEWLTDGADSL